MRVFFFDSLDTMMDLLSGGFQDAGHDVYVSGAASMDEMTEKLNRFQPELVITNGWGNEQTEDNQLWVRNFAKTRNIPHVYWSIEDPSFTESFVLPLARRAEPDFIFTISSATVDYFRSIGIRAAHLDWGYQPDLHYPHPPEQQYSCDIALIANSYSWVFDQWDIGYRIESMRTLLCPLIENNIRVDIFGKGWDQIKPWIGMDIHPDWLRGPLPYQDCSRVYSSSKIVIGLQNFTSQVTQRTYETLAAGGFLLTSDTPAVRQLFTPGHDLVVAGNPLETVQLVNYYLNHPADRTAICRNGLQAVSLHSYRQRAEYMLQVLRSENIIQG